LEGIEEEPCHGCGGGHALRPRALAHVALRPARAHERSLPYAGAIATRGRRDAVGQELGPARRRQGGGSPEKPVAAAAGAKIFETGGNAVDAACAMLAATATAWTTLSWGGETQALIYNPGTGKVIAINGLGAAPTGATPEFFRKLGLRYPPEFGPLAAVTPGTPGGLMT